MTYIDERTAMQHSHNLYASLFDGVIMQLVCDVAGNKPVPFPDDISSKINDQLVTFMDETPSQIKIMLMTRLHNIIQEFVEK